MIDFFFLTESVWEADVPPSSIEMCLSLLHQVYARMWFFENLHGSVYWPAYFTRYLSFLIPCKGFCLSMGLTFISTLHVNILGFYNH